MVILLNMDNRDAETVQSATTSRKENAATITPLKHTHHTAELLSVQAVISILNYN